MKVSILTAAFNSEATIERTMVSVSNQDYPGIEYIIIDGCSTDSTLAVVKTYKDKITKIVSEPDIGIYEALNKGIGLASGDVIGFLHSDDFYANDQVIGKVVGTFERQNVDSCYGDLLYVSRDAPNKVVRYWRSSNYRGGKFRYGWMPPHPTFFVKREIYEKYGVFNTHFRIAADYELMLRLLEKHKISTCYIPEVLIKMRIGGTSNRGLKNIFVKSFEDYKAWKVNGLKGGLPTVFLKNFSKIPQFFVR